MSWVRPLLFGAGRHAAPRRGPLRFSQGGLRKTRRLPLQLERVPLQPSRQHRSPVGGLRGRSRPLHGPDPDSTGDHRPCVGPHPSPDLGQHPGRSLGWMGAGRHNAGQGLVPGVGGVAAVSDDADHRDRDRLGQLQFQSGTLGRHGGRDTLRPGAALGHVGLQRLARDSRRWPRRSGTRNATSPGP